AHAARQRAATDLLGQALPHRGGEPLRVVRALDELARREDDGSRHDRPGERAAPGLVDPSDVAEPPAPELFLQYEKRGGIVPIPGPPPRFQAVLPATRAACHVAFALAVPLADAGSLATQLAQIVELRAADAATPDNGQRLDRRRVQREDPLDAHAVRDLAHREGLADLPALARDADALEDLDALLVALAHPDVH